MYKARDRQTGQKVAIKVVRKYELNSNQVRTIDLLCSRLGSVLRRLRSVSVPRLVSTFLLCRAVARCCSCLASRPIPFLLAASSPSHCEHLGTTRELE